MDGCKCKNCGKYPDSKLLSARTCSISGCENKFHPMVMDDERHLCDSHINMQHKVDATTPRFTKTPNTSDQEYGGLPVVDQRFPPKQCISCGKWWQPSKYTWKYAQKCSDCGKPKASHGSGVKTKQIPCVECSEMVEVGVFASNTQYCDKCRDEKGLTKKGNPKPKSKKNFNETSPQHKVEQFGNDVDRVKKTMLSVGNNGDNNKETEQFYTALSQLDAERLILNGIEDNDRVDTIKEDIHLYLIPRGFKISKTMLWKKYRNMEFVSLIFFRNRLHHITYKFEKPNREESRLIITRENYEKLSEQIKEDIDLVVALSGVLKDESPLTDEYIEYIKKVSYEQHTKYDEMG